MRQVPAPLIKEFNTLLVKNKIRQRNQSHYSKWLRYYLDFCYKYGLKESDTQSLSDYIDKLKEKKQTAAQQQQAVKAINIYYSLIQSQSERPEKKPAQQSDKAMVVQESPGSFRATPQAKSQPTYGKPDSALKKAVQKDAKQCWGNAFTDLGNEIKVRHYSPKTLKSYSTWVRKLCYHCKVEDPELLKTGDVKEFLTYLAVKQKVSASSQNQAFNALLFFFRHVLDREFGEIDGVVRAKRTRYIPVVLSREEIDAIIRNLKYPYDLVVKLLYGCGLRLFECLNLRINSFNFDFNILTVHDGKGKKDRTVPLPQIIMPDLKAHQAKIKTLHDKDLNEGYAGASLILLPIQSIS